MDVFLPLLGGRRRPARWGARSGQRAEMSVASACECDWRSGRPGLVLALSTRGELMANAKFLIYKDKVGEYRWRLVASN
jgi:hypothetical protein